MKNMSWHACVSVSYNSLAMLFVSRESGRRIAIHENDFAKEKIMRGVRGNERFILRTYTGADISEPDAQVLWQRILDHKWYVSEQLCRDVGFRVAALDYVENFYEPFQLTKNASVLSVYWRAFMKSVSGLVRRYFELKGDTIPS